MQLLGVRTDIRFDFGVISALEEVLAALGVSRALLVTDPGLAKSDLYPLTKRASGGRIASEFTETLANPDQECCEKAVALYRQYECDGVVALGGGSSMDLAKAVALMATHDGVFASYGLSEGKVINEVAPIVAIPTTAGTGSEISGGAVITLKEGRKEVFASANLVPSASICDPELTLGLPPLLTAATGMDAVTHCIEAILSPNFAPQLEAIGYDGLRRAVKESNLEKAVSDGSDRQARWEMMFSAMEGAMAFAKGLGPVHAISHACGHLPGLRLHHGTLNAIFLPGVLRFGEGEAPEKYARIAESMGLPKGACIATAVEKLNEKLGIPTSLGELGVKDDDIDSLIDHAMTDAFHELGVKIPSREDYKQFILDVI